MKYFTYDAWQNITSSTLDENHTSEDIWHEQCLQYSNEFEIAKRRLPVRFVQKIAECCYFHDASITDIKLMPYQYSGNSSSLEIHIVYIEKKYIIKYTGVVEFKYSKLLENVTNMTLNDRKFMIGYDEFLPVGENLISHEMLFDNGDTVLVVFDKIKLFVQNKFGRLVSQ